MQEDEFRSESSFFFAVNNTNRFFMTMNCEVIKYAGVKGV